MEQFRCQECPAVFAHKKGLTRHQREKHGGEAPQRYLCDDCGASFFRLENLRQHIREKHVDTTPEFLCEKCGLGFSRITYLQRHREADKFRFFHASKNNARVWDKPKTISRFRDISSIVDDLKAVDTLECMAAHQTGTRRCVEARARALFHQCTDTSVDGFEGVTLRKLDELEDVFRVDIDVFEFKYDPPCLVLHRRSSYKHGDVLHLLLVHGCHFCYIEDIDAATHAFGCEKSGRQYKERKKLGRHEKRCAGDKIKRYYPGGIYHPNPTPLEVLVDDGVLVETDFVYPFRATYDFECYFTKNDIPTTSTSKTSYTARHVPLSVTVCSNVPRFENPMCLISDGDPQNLVDRMGDYLEEISTSAFQILRQTCFKEAFEYLETLREDDVKDRSNLKGTLFKYLSQLPVVGFNSGKYHLNVIKPYLAQRFLVPKDDDYDSEGEEGSGFRQTRKRGKSFQELRERTAEITQYLREEVCVKVIEMYECEWEEMKEADDQTVDFINTHLPQSSSIFSISSSVTKFSILRDIFDGFLHGLVRCDIKVPESLRGHFSEMPPIFKNIEVSREDIGSFMRDFAMSTSFSGDLVEL
ncbi:zinc finger protein 546-like [Elysia marginata]|uniref:Zinc finger protein 546-like n=1 Tax=Elysia marginata TaxID=1093978 RepID=A0AAV4J968_9GAST|nr:zinc finger protein 546-like [Elysia marginata]